MNKEEFLQKYILARTSHKRSLDELLEDALKAWEFTQKNK